MTQKVLKILLLEDGQDDVVLIIRALRKSGVVFEARVTDCREGFLQEVTEFSPDIILSDHSLPQFNSIEALRICKDKGLQIPFVLVTGSVPVPFASRLLKTGISGYVLKSDLEKLPSFIFSLCKNQDFSGSSSLALN